ncbi:MAG: hypothetical protein ABH859_08635 [Pseudomonadota bacterium]
MSETLAIARFNAALQNDSWLDASELREVYNALRQDEQQNNGQQPLENLELVARLTRSAFVTQEIGMDRFVFISRFESVIDEVYDECYEPDPLIFNLMCFLGMDLSRPMPGYCSILPDRADVDFLTWRY